MDQIFYTDGYDPLQEIKDRIKQNEEIYARYFKPDVISSNKDSHLLGIRDKLNEKKKSSNPLV